MTLRTVVRDIRAPMTFGGAPMIFPPPIGDAPLPMTFGGETSGGIVGCFSIDGLFNDIGLGGIGTLPLKSMVTFLTTGCLTGGLYLINFDQRAAFASGSSFTSVFTG